MELKEEFKLKNITSKSLEENGMVFHSTSGYKPATFFDSPFLKVIYNGSGKAVRLEMFDSIENKYKKPSLVVELV